MLSYVVWLVVGTLVYLSFLDNRSVDEWVAGAFVTAGSIWLARAAFRAAGLSYHPDLPRLWRLGAVFRIIAAECWAVFVALVRHLTGRKQIQGEIVAIPVDGRLVQGADEVAFDAAITVEAGLAPNTFILGLVEKQEVLLVHQLVPQAEPERSFPRWASGTPDVEAGGGAP